MNQIRDVYADDLTLREARDRYFIANKFGADGGYSLDWVQVKLGPLPLVGLALLLAQVAASPVARPIIALRSRFAPGPSASPPAQG